MHRRFSGGLALVALTLCATSVNAQTVTFAQISDAHLFDVPAQIKEEAEYEALKHQAALVDAVLAVNRLVASGTRLDFVAFTGDFGTASLEPAAVEARADEIARAFRTLLTPRIFVLPGDRDVDAKGGRSTFDVFVARMRQAVGKHKLTDLTLAPAVVNDIDVIGLETTALARGSTVATPAGQAKTIAQAVGRIRDGHVAILFAHVPPIDRINPKSNEKPALWDLAKDAAASWNRLLQRRELIAVFAGHVHDLARDQYSQSKVLSGAEPLGARAVVWVAPPLTGVPATGTASPAVGFLLATVTTAASVTVKPNWLPADVPTAAVIESSELLKGRAYEKAWELDKAESAYEKALGSNDAGVRAAAEAGFTRTRELKESWRWPFIENIAPARLITHQWRAATATLSIALLFMIVSFARRNPRLGPTVKLTTDAASDLFIEELLASMREARHALNTEAESGIVSASTASVTLSRAPSGELMELLKSLPTVGGMALGTTAATLLKYVRWFRRRLDLFIAGNGSDVCAFGELRHAWWIEASWREPPRGEGPLDTVAVAQRMAYNLVWELRRK